MIYTEPRKIDDLDQCDFYHTMTVPGQGQIQGNCDMRSTIPTTLDPINFANQRVLEIGPANGFYTFEMEKRGAEVVACELEPDGEWDVTPHPYESAEVVKRRFREHIEQIQNGFWFCHAAFESKAKVVRSSVYDLPDSIGQFDIAAIHNVLLHLRDPIRAIENVATVTKNTLIISDLEPFAESRKATLLRLLSRRLKMQTFLPRRSDSANRHTWWHFSAPMTAEMCQLVGFPNVQTRYHVLDFRNGHLAPGYSIVASR